MELDRIVPNNITSGLPEDLGLIELLWKQDVDLGVGKEVYDQSLREELERQRELEYHEQQEKLKAQRAAHERESRSKQEEASRWLQQYFMRDGETGEWVKKTTKNNESAIEETKEDDFLTLEAALDYISSSVDPSELVFNPEDVPAATSSFSEDLSNLQADHVESHGYVMPPMLQQPTDLENEWIEVEQYLNISLREPSTSGMSAIPQDLNDLDAIDIKAVVAAAVTPLDTDLPQVMEPVVFTSADLPLLQDATMPSPDMEPVPELGTVSLSNATLPPQNSSLDWELGNLTFFNNLTVLPEGSEDDMDLHNMESLFNTMTEASDLTNITSTDLDDLMMTRGLNDTATTASMNTSFSGELGDAFDGLEGATGGADLSNGNNLDAPYRKISRLSESSSDSGFGGKGGFSSPASSSSYDGSPVDSSMAHNSTNSNDTDHDPHGTQTLAHQVAHNHTYNTLPGHVPREVKKYAPKEASKKGPQCRDQKRAQELKVPFTVDQIVDSPVETFNDIITKYNLNEDQLSLIRDIRRRGKNKLAAQNCRKRKVGAIVTLSDEMIDLQKVRDRLKTERAEMEKETRKMKEKFGHLYTHIFQSLRDEHGLPYDPNLYSLQQSSDGNVFLVPRNATNGLNGTSHSTTSNGGHARRNDITRIKKRRSDN